MPHARVFRGLPGLLAVLAIAGAVSVQTVPVVASAPSLVPAGFVKASSLTHARAYHTATLLPDGRVLIVGGNDDTKTLATAELYNPTTGKFTATGSMVHARERHTATLLPNGRVLITGGIGTAGFPSGVLALAELYDPETGTFKRRARWPTPGSLTRRPCC